ncbi:MAG: radical SAM protein [Acidobacteriota bacterium]
MRASSTTKDFYIQWHITDHCNLRCIDCYQDSFTSGGELDMNGLKKICTGFKEAMDRWDCKLKVALTGGEPLLKKEIWALLEILDAADFVSETGIITNGTMFGRDSTGLNASKSGHAPEELRRFQKLRNVFVSLDGATAATNDLIRGNGTFKKTVRNIRSLAEAAIPVTIMFTLMKQNLHEAPAMFELSLSLGVDGLIVERFIPLGQGKKITDCVVSGYELNDLYEKICLMCDLTYDPEEMVKYRAIKIEFIAEAESAMRRPHLYGAECIVARDGMALLPDGTVLPCRRFNLPIGNMLHEPLYKIWDSSEVLNEIRKRENLKGVCGVCEIPDCIGCRAMTFALTGDYLAEDPHCWKEG